MRRPAGCSVYPSSRAVKRKSTIIFLLLACDLRAGKRTRKIGPRGADPWRPQCVTSP